MLRRISTLTNGPKVAILSVNEPANGRYVVTTYTVGSKAPMVEIGQYERQDAAIEAQLEAVGLEEDHFDRDASRVCSRYPACEAGYCDC